MNKAYLIFGITLITGALPRTAAAGLITDRSFFEEVNHTLIDFESLGDGTPLTLDILPFSRNLDIALDEYALQGVVFASENGMILGRDSSFGWQQALVAGGSPTVSVAPRAVQVGNMLEQDFQVFFTSSIHAVGFFVLLGDELPHPAFQALGNDGSVLGTFGLNDQTLDGNIDGIEFGFIGFSSATPIASVRLTSGIFAFDDLMFSSVPAPGGALVMLGATGALGLRRRR